MSTIKKGMCMNKLVRLGIFLSLSLTLLLSVARGQVSTGQIGGAVTDQTGAAVAGATVTVTGQDGTKRNATTNDNGNYLITLLPSGVYRVEISATNFKSLTFDAVRVRITETTQIDGTLGVGDANAEIVTVAPETPLIQAETSSNGRVIGETTLRQLPLPTRNFQQLLTLSAGTSANITNTSEVGRGDTAINVNGQRTTSNSVLINGIDANSIGTGSTPNLAVPATDALQEFIVLTSQFDASNGRGVGGIVTAVTKSGTNEFHGNAYYFLRNKSLNANDFFLNQQGIDRQRNDRNQFGGTFGGRLIKDRLFFFGSYQGTREVNGTSRTNSLAVIGTPRDLTDNRSDAALAALSRTRVPGLAAFGAAGFVNPVARQLLQARLPDGSFLIPSGNGATSRTLPAESDFDEDQFSINIDGQVTNSNRLGVKFFFANNSIQQGLFSQFGLANALQTPGFAVDTTADNRLLTVTDTQVFSNGFVNEIRFGYNAIPTTATPQQPFTASQFGIRTPNAAGFPGLPAIGLNNLFTVGPSGFSSSDNQADTLTIGDTLTFSAGNHNIKLGGEYRRNRVRLDFDIFANGSITFTGALANNPALAPLFAAGSRDAFSEFLVSNFAPTFNPVFSIIGPGNALRDIRANDVSGFLQDDWKVNSRLTLNIGVRYDYYGPFFDTQGRFVTFDPSVPGAGAPGTLNGFLQANNARTPVPGIPAINKSLVTPDRNNFAPRIGFALRPFNGNRFVVRGGYGVYYDRGNARAANNQGLSFPYYTLAPSLFARSFADPFVPIPQQFPVNLPNGLPFVGTDGRTPIAVQGIYPDRFMRTPYVQQYSLGFQYEIFRDTQLEVNYVGSLGRKLTRFRNVNQTAGPNITNLPPALSPTLSVVPTIGFGVFIQESSANSNYNALQVTLTRRLAKGLQGLVAYTYSHAIDEYSGQATSGGTSDVSADLGNQATFAGNRATADFDRRQRIVSSFVYDVPKLYRGDNGLLKTLINDFQVSAVSTFQTGLPFSIASGGGLFDASRANFAPGFSGIGSDAATEGGGVRDRLNGFFNPLAFVQATGVGNFGNTGRNILRGPAQANTDISVVKFFQIRERQRLEFRTEFFNAFNQVNFANPVSSGAPALVNGALVTTNPNFGRILATSTGPRIVQFALKFQF